MIKGKKAKFRIGDIVIYNLLGGGKMILGVVLEVNENVLNYGLHKSEWHQKIAVLVDHRETNNHLGEVISWENDALELYKDWKEMIKFYKEWKSNGTE